MLTFGIDWDDVISPLNDCAIELANQEYQFDPPLTLEDINSWENTGRIGNQKYYNDRGCMICSGYPMRQKLYPEITDKRNCVYRNGSVSTVYVKTGGAD